MNRIWNARRVCLPSLFVTLCLVACGSTKPKVPASMNKLSDNQQATVGTAVKNPPSVSILDADGKGVGGITVTFNVATGGGSLAGAPTVTTNSDGVATAGAWTLGTTIGTNIVTAAAANVPGSPVTLTAIAVAGPPALMTKVSVDPASAPAGSNIDSIVVRVTDSFSNPVGGVAVTFAVTGGNGSVSPATTLTNGFGLASARWTVGTNVGEANAATASASGLAPGVSFNTLSRPPVAAVRFGSPVFIVDSSGSISPSVSAFDPQGNAVTGAPITLAARSPTAVTVSGASVTGQHPGQSVIVATSSDNAGLKDSAILIVANAASPVVFATFPRFDLKTDTVFTVPIVVDMRSSGLKVGAATLQVSWDPTLLIFQGSAPGANVANVTSNETNVGAGSLTMTFADGTGFANQVEVRKLTFKAAATAGRTGALNLTALDLVSTTTADLRSKTVTSFYPLRTR